MVRVVSRIWWRGVRGGFWLLYNPLAFTYDTVSWVVSMGAWREWTHASLRYLSPQAGWILELAHGPGHLQHELHTRGEQVIGYDRSPAMGRLARRRLVRAGFTPRLVQGKAEQLPFGDAQFSTLISTFPTEFIVSHSTLTEIWRVLRPGGRLIVVPGAAFTGTGLARRMLDLAYRATGQQHTRQQAVQAEADPLEPMRTHFEQFGFTTSGHLEACHNSTAYVIVAEKPAL